MNIYFIIDLFVRFCFLGFFFTLLVRNRCDIHFSFDEKILLLKTLRSIRVKRLAVFVSYLMVVVTPSNFINFIKAFIVNQFFWVIINIEGKSF